MNRLARIVRHGKGLHLQTTDRKRCVTIDQTIILKLRLHAPEPNKRAMRQDNRNVITRRKTRGPGNMITMFMRDQ